MSPGPSDMRAEAAEWFVLLDSGRASEGDRARHRAWLAAHSEHRDAYASVQQTFDVARMRSEEHTSELQSL